MTDIGTEQWRNRILDNARSITITEIRDWHDGTGKKENILQYVEGALELKGDEGELAKFGNYILKSLFIAVLIIFFPLDAGIASVYSFPPTIIKMVKGSGTFLGSRSAIGANPSAIMALPSASAAFPVAGSNWTAARMWMPVVALTPIVPQSVSTVIGDVDGIERHLAASNMVCSRHAKDSASPPTATDNIYFWSRNKAICSTMLACWFADNVRGANSSSRTIIFDCCAVLIRSSTTNSVIVNSVSKATPAITSQKATRWMAAEYVGRSNNMPTPTAIPANALPGTSTRWGQTGFSVPAQTILMYAQIAAILVWAVVSLMALERLTRALLDLWRQRGRSL